MKTGLYIGIVPGIPGAHTQAEALDELQRNLLEVVELCLEEMDSESRELIPEFMEVQQFQIAISRPSLAQNPPRNRHYRR